MRFHSGFRAFHTSLFSVGIGDGFSAAITAVDSAPTRLVPVATAPKTPDSAFLAVEAWALTLWTRADSVAAFHGVADNVRDMLIEFSGVGGHTRALDGRTSLRGSHATDRDRVRTIRNVTLA